MKKIITLSSFSLLFLFLFTTIVTQSSCQKQSTNCAAVVTVTDVNNNPVSGATVTLYAPNSQAGATGITNSAGNADFNFSLPAIFNISASKVVGANTLKGSGVIQLQVGGTATATVVIQ